jgi:hypothetical protein
MRKALSLCLIMAIMFVALFGTNTVHAAGTVMGTTPKASPGNVGVNFNVNVTVAEVANLYVWEMNMTFNATVLNVVNIVEGPFLQSLGSWWLDPVIDNVNGRVGAGCTLFPYPEHGADGNGVLATVTFNVLMKGKSNLHFADTKLRSWDPIGGLLVEITHTRQDGFFRCPFPDVNGDGVVNVIDGAGVSSHWYPGPPLGPLGYGIDYDIERDGIIGVTDAAKVSAYWTGPPKGPLDP